MIDNRLKELCRKRLKKSRTEYSAAIVNKDAGFYEVANTRAYYAAFHAVRAILALDNVEFKKHSQVIGYFNKNYINTNIIDRSLGAILANASVSRNNSDYDDFYEADLEEAEGNIKNVYILLKIIEKHVMEKLGG